MSETRILTPGKALIALVNFVTLVGPYAADWNETHIYNPNWPPHARYHNGQTMSLGLFTGLISFYVLFVLEPRSVSPEVKKTHLSWVLLLQNMMYLSSLSGILYPGAGWMDPQFGDGKPQLYGFPVLVAMVWAGWGLEMGRLKKEKGLKRG